MIKIENLVKQYGDIRAVDNISFEVNEGEIVGFLGPNGAGKSTTMNMLTGYLSSTSGKAMIDGIDILEQPLEAKKRIGFLPEQPPLYLDMTVEEYLNFIYDLKGCRLNRRKHLHEICEVVRINEVYKRIIRNLSKGYRQRVGIAQALVGNPKVIIFDEPTVGLDPKQIIEIRNLIRGLGKDHTVILSSHILPEISAVCDYVIIIAHGQIVASDTLENLTKKYEGRNYVDMTVRGDEAKIRRAVESIPAVESVEIEPDALGRHHVRVAADNQSDIREELFFRFADMRAPILSMEYEEVTLEKVFLELTGETKKKSVPADEAPADEIPVSESEVEEIPAEDAQTPEPEEPENESADQGDDDYKPLFGGN